MLYYGFVRVIRPSKRTKTESSYRRAIKGYIITMSTNTTQKAMDNYRNFIDGKWVESSSSRTVSNINPANTDDIIGTVKQATRDEARAAVEAAAEAFHGWRTTPAPSRGRIVARAARLLEENQEELAQTLTREEGKTIAESR